ncbi:MAG: hypothetical protein AAB066_01965 [Candidatus Margulisiibacteriota bacterium]
MSADAVSAGAADAARSAPAATEFYSSAFNQVQSHCENCLQGLAHGSGAFPVDQARDQLQVIAGLPSVEGSVAASRFVSALITTVESAPISPVRKADIALWMQRALALAKDPASAPTVASGLRPDNPFKPKIPQTKKTTLSERRPLRDQRGASSETPSRNIF